MSGLNPFEATYSEELYHLPQPIVVATSIPWKSLSESDIELLSKILQSVRLTLGGVKVIETSAIDLEEWIDKPRRFIGFGINISDASYYELINRNDCQFVLADSLPVLGKQDDLKKKLWVALKQLFFAQ